MMDTKVEVFKRVEVCFKKAEIFFEVKLPRPKISFDIRGQDAGRAYFPVRRYKNTSKQLQTEIKFNEFLLERNPGIFLENIVPHECAHLIVYDLFGTKVKPHGEQWQSIMEGLFNADASVRHDLDVSALVNKPFIYRCDCDNDGLPLAKRQHINIQKGSKYLCRRCRATLQYAYTKSEDAVAKPRIEKNIPCLYIYSDKKLEQLAANKNAQENLTKRLSSILNRNRPEKIYTSSELAGQDFFKNWLRKEALLRRYYGHLDIECFSEKVNDRSADLNEVSHLIVIAGKLGGVEKEYFLKLEREGVRVRQLRI